MSKKILRKRKGQWITLSLSLATLVTVGSASQQIVAAQDVATHYVVHAGDTLYSIANRHGISLEQLKVWNNLSSNTIFPGSNLVVSQNSIDNEDVSDSSENKESNVNLENLNPTNPVEPEENNNLPQVNNGSIYVVQVGDFVNQIAAKHGITAQQLRVWNNLASDLIHPGDRLIVSNGSNTTPEAPEENENIEQENNNDHPTNDNQETSHTYTVKAGDYLYAIAERFGVTINNLQDWNNLTSNYIYVGDILNVKSPTHNIESPTETDKPDENNSSDNTTTKNQFYTVKAGDFINRIASMHGISANQLKQWNKLTSNLIHPGDRLIVAKSSIEEPNTQPEDQGTDNNQENDNNNNSKKTHTVVAGDYLYKVANEYGVTVEDLIAWNNLPNNYIYVGDVLYVSEPTNTKPDPVEDNTPEDKPEVTKPITKYHTVRAGEFINKIAADYGITSQQLRQWNNLSSNLIHPGDRLIVAQDQASSDNETPTEDNEETTPPIENTNKTYRVKPGDYLYKIATAHGVSVANLIEWNNLSSNYLYAGDVLYVARPSSPGNNHSNPGTNIPSNMPDLTNVVPTSVNYDVKLNGLTQSFRKTRSAMGQDYNVVDYFGDRFTVNNEYYANGTTYLELMNNYGQIFGYVPASAVVQVPQGVNTIYLDAGHGGWETGARNYGVNEKDLNLNITTQLAQKLRDSGYHVYETRTSDQYVDLRERQNEPNRLMPDAYISIHHNAMPIPGTAHGIVTLYHDPSIDERNYETLDHHLGTNIIPDGKRLSNAIQNALIRETGANNQGTRPQNLHVTRTTDVPATLVELGFQDHPKEHQKLIDPSYQQKLITGLLNGINAYFGRTK